METTTCLSRLLLAITFLCTTFILKAEEEAIFAIYCPDDVYADCEDELWDLSIYGDAYVQTYNGTQSAGDPVETWALNNCDVGHIYRTWTVEDYQWNQHTCTQVIFVSSTGGFTESDISWPADVELYGCNPDTDPHSFPPGQGYPTYPEPACSNIAVGYTDQVFHFNGTCDKIVRKWTVIDWCQNGYNGKNGMTFTYLQKIKISDTSEPVYLCPENIEVPSYNCKDAEVIQPPLVIHPSECGGYYEVSNNSPFAYYNGADLSGIYPIGTTNVQYTIKFGCGFKKYCNVHVVVKNASAPVPYCLYEVTTALMPMDEDGDGIPEDGMVGIWAKDLDLGSYSPCGFHVTASFSPDSIVMNKFFTCAEVGVNYINIYYHDSKGNVSFCSVKIHIQNNGANIPDCHPVDPNAPTYGHISGRVQDVFNTDVADLDIQCLNEIIDTEIITTYDTTTTQIAIDSFYNHAGNLIYHMQDVVEITETIDTIISEFRDLQSVATITDGTYIFDSVAMYNDYKISGAQLEMPSSKLEKCDLEVLRDHILGIELITDPYLLLAADIDDNNRVDFDDFKHLLFLLTGKIDELPTDHEVMLVPADAEMTDPLAESPLQYIEYTDLDTSMYNSNFIYIVKGNLCDATYGTPIQSEENMNILTSIADKLPVVFRSQLVKEAPSIFSKPAEFAVYPNPFKESFVFSINNPTNQMINWSVFDNNGKQILSGNDYLEKGFHSIDVLLKDYPSGIYFYQVLAGQSQSHGRVVKK